MVLRVTLAYWLYATRRKLRLYSTMHCDVVIVSVLEDVKNDAVCFVCFVVVDFHSDV